MIAGGLARFGGVDVLPYLSGLRNCSTPFEGVSSGGGDCVMCVATVVIVAAAELGGDDGCCRCSGDGGDGRDSGGWWCGVDSRRGGRPGRSKKVSGLLVCWPESPGSLGMV